MATIEFRHVTKSYARAVHALRDFNLRVEEGEFCVFVGPSGCGKSTALKLLAGLEPTTEGEILIDGRVVTDLGPGKRDIAMVFQNYALYPHMSVRANMAFGLKMRHTPREQVTRRVEEAARLLELTDYLDRRPRELSGGQRQRVALGRAIVREPKAFLMDEPLSNLDAKLRVQTRSEIVKLQRRLGVTTIYVTHDQTEALTMANKIVVMRSGVVQQVGSPDELFHNPSNLFVAGFIGSPGMNFFSGPVEVEGERAFTRFAGARVPLPVSAAAVAGLGGQAVFGIRPEHLAINDESLGVSLTATLVESLGTEKILHFDRPVDNVLPRDLDAGRGAREDIERDTMLVRVIDDVSYASGGIVPVTLPAAKIHIFDPRTQGAIQ